MNEILRLRIGKIEMFAVFSRVCPMPLLALGLLSGGLPVPDTAAESVERNYNVRTNYNLRSNSNQSSEQSRDESGDRAATTSGFFNNWLGSRSTRRQRSTSRNRDSDALSTRTKIYGAQRSVVPMLNARSAQALESAIGHYENIARRGGWGRIASYRSLRPGAKGRAVLALRRRLAIEGYLPKGAIGSNVYDGGLAQAVAGFQRNNGLPRTGQVGKATAKALSVSAKARVDTMRANLIRMPEYTKELGRKYVLVNIPAARLEAVEGNRVASSHTVIVGKPERPSPIVTSEISEINFNPYWHSPKSIVIKDIVPQVRRSRRILKKMRIRIFDGYRGPEVNPRSINWRAPAEEIADRYHFRQDPGGGNAMASVKINFRNEFSVYMHDTPTKSLFEESQRYFSSGCVRVEDVHQLTSWVLANQDGWNLKQIKSVARSEDRIDVDMKSKVAVHWVYLTAWAGPDGMVRFRDDIYGLDGTGFITGQPIGSPEGRAG